MSKDKEIYILDMLISLIVREIGVSEGSVGWGIVKQRINVDTKRDKHRYK